MLSGDIPLSLLAGFGVGYLYVFGYMKFFEASQAKAKQWESKFPFSKYSRHPSFVPCDGANASGLPTFVRT